MRPSPGVRTWTRYFFYRAECTKTTWTLRISVVVVAALLMWLTPGLWTPWIGRSVVCTESVRPADALLLENFDPDYLLFERAEELTRAGLVKRVLVPAQALTYPGDPRPVSPVSAGFVEVMARLAHLPTPEVVPIKEREPVVLNAAYQLRDFLRGHGITSVLIVTSAFRSRRSQLVYDRVFGDAGIAVSCLPVYGTVKPDNWTHTWHGIQEVTAQVLKLHYYRFYVMPFQLR